MRHRGAPAPGFPSIVAGGPHGALPHAEPRDVEIAAGTLLVIDWGAQIEGYCSDCTRTVATGELDGEAAEVYALVQRAQRAGLEAVRAGPSGREVDAVARAIIEEAGRGDEFGHGLGHGVGLEVHEEPSLRNKVDDLLQEGDVLTVEPGLYLLGLGGVRVEDTGMVTGNGFKNFTALTRSLDPQDYL